MKQPAACWLLAAVLLAGCGERSSSVPEGRPLPNPNAPASYRAATGTASAGASRPKGVSEPALPAELQRYQTNWRNAPFSVIETELSPAVLVRSTNRYLGLFGGLAPRGLGAPSHVAWSTPGGPRPFKSGEALDVAGMEENWVLAWFSGSGGWTNWDSPWAIFLQHRPASMRLDSDGLHFTFSNRAGDVVLLPLYGAYKPPLPGPDPLETHGLPGRKIKTWEWSKALPRDPLVRLRFWAGASRQFPIRCVEHVSVDPAHDSVRFRSRFEWHAIDDEWRTKPLKLAPISPSLALAIVEPGFPAEFSTKPFDLEMFTPSGPYFGVPGVDEFDVTFPVLQYVHETRVAPSPSSGVPAEVRAAWERLQRPGAFRGPAGATSWSDASRLARALPFLEGATRTNAIRWLQTRLASGPETTVTALASEPAEARFEAIWAYAHFSGDWDWVRQRWPEIRSAFQIGSGMSWAGFGRRGVVENARLASPCAAFARLAYQAGDMESYAYGCALFARELVHHWIKQRGAAYFRKQQPIHSTEFMGDDVRVTEFEGGLAGWNLDGPSFPAGTAARRYGHRWDVFGDWDIARFYRDYLGNDLRRERAWMKSGSGVADATAWSPPLTALLLGSLSNAVSEAATANPAGASTASADARSLQELFADSMWAMASGVERYERLIGAGDPISLDVALESPGGARGEIPRALVCAVQFPDGTGAAWPELGWNGWRTPSGGRWTFGQIKLARYGALRSVRKVPLNGNTTGCFFEP